LIHSGNCSRSFSLTGGRSASLNLKLNIKNYLKKIARILRQDRLFYNKICYTHRGTRYCRVSLYRPELRNLKGRTWLLMKYLVVGCSFAFVTICMALPAPKYLSVPHWERCVRTVTKGTAKFVCLPSKKPDRCMSLSWQLLSNQHLVERCSTDSISRSSVRVPSPVKSNFNEGY
jgi:hypothetical protein